MPVHNLTLFADYFQFYLQDEPSKGELSEAWTDEAVADLLALAPGVVGVGTVRNMDVPVRVELASAPPPTDYDGWDHVTECDLDVPSGRIVIAGCTDYFPDAVRITVDPGNYRVRIRYGGFDTLSEDGLRGDDRYDVVLWKAPPEGRRVLKRHAPFPKRAV
jgi:hypothetical protein